MASKPKNVLSLDDLFPVITREANQRRVRVEQSFFDATWDYYNLIRRSQKPLLRESTQEDLVGVIAVASNRALQIALRERMNQLNDKIFKAALLEFKDPYHDPDDTCEEAAQRILAKRREFSETLPHSLREFFRGDRDRRYA
jgi:hypothetical protein